MFAVSPGPALCIAKGRSSTSASKCPCPAETRGDLRELSKGAWLGQCYQEPAKKADLPSSLRFPCDGEKPTGLCWLLWWS